MAIVMSRLVPAVALAVPFYLLIQALGLLGTQGRVDPGPFGADPAVHGADPRSFSAASRPEIEDAAIVDGCTRLQLFWRIVLPLSLPSLAATGLFAFMLSYAEFLFALVLSGDAANRPLSVVMASLARNVDVSWGILNSAIFLAVLPRSRWPRSSGAWSSKASWSAGSRASPTPGPPTGRQTARLLSRLGHRRGMVIDDPPLAARLTRVKL